MNKKRIINFMLDAITEDYMRSVTLGTWKRRPTDQVIHNKISKYRKHMLLRDKIHGLEDYERKYLMRFYEFKKSVVVATKDFGVLELE